MDNVEDKLTNNKPVVLISTFLVLLALCTSTSALYNLLIIIRTSLNIPIPSMVWLTGGYSMVVGSLQMVSGQLSNKFGFLIILFFGAVIFCIASMLMAFAWLPWVAILAALLQGVGVSALFPISLAVIDRYASLENKNFLLTLWTGLQGLGFILGPLLGAIFAQWMNWRYFFVLISGISFLSAFLLGIQIIKESPDKVDAGSTKPLDYVGCLLFFIGFSSMVLWLNQGIAWGWRSTLMISLYVLSILLLGAFFVIERKKINPLLNMAIFKYPYFMLGSLLYALNYFILYGFLFIFFVFTQAHSYLNFSSMQAALSILPLLILIVIFPFFSNKLSQTFSYESLISFGWVCILLAWVCLYFFPFVHYVHIWPFLLILSFGFAFSISVTPNYTLQAIPKALKNEASSLLTTIAYLGSTLGIVVTNLAYLTRCVNYVQLMSATEHGKAHLLEVVEKHHSLGADFSRGISFNPDLLESGIKHVISAYILIAIAALIILWFGRFKRTG